ncbi:MAG: OadG family protein [Ignavibacterium sp.]|nr:MAG: OadG family protein [Ignavibacterium sp.]
MNPIVDSVKVLADTLSSAGNQSQALHEIGFNPNNIIENDGLLISVVGYVVVFLALLMLYIIFSNLTRFLIFRQRKRLKGAGKESDLQKEKLSMTGEVNAAISMALYLHFEEIHDLETTVLTIKKVQKTYSPWSSKIYGLREYPKRR